MDEQAVALLLESVKRFNEWKAQQPKAIDLDGAVLAQASLGGADLSGASLKEADLRGADLSGANLDSAVLYRTQAGGAVFARCKMHETYAAEGNFESANFSQVRANAANFSRAKLQGASLDHGRLFDVLFDGADMSGASMVGALLVRTKLPSKDIDLKHAVIEKGTRTPPMPSVDFSYIGEDAVTFAIGQWTPRPGAGDDEVSNFVLNLRKFNRGDADVIKGFAKLVAGLVKSHHRLSACDAIVNVPSSKTDAQETPVRAVCREAAKVSGLKDGTGWLVRHKTVLPSGLINLFSNEDKHLDSIRVAHNDVVNGRSILLFDDFVDTGCTFRASRHLLLAAGAKRVFCLALARRLKDPAEEP